MLIVRTIYDQSIFLSFCNDYKMNFLAGVILLLRGPAQNDAIYMRGVDEFVVTLFKHYSFLLFYYLTILILHLTKARCNTCCLHHSGTHGGKAEDDVDNLLGSLFNLYITCHLIFLLLKKSSFVTL